MGGAGAQPVVAALGGSHSTAALRRDANEKAHMARRDVRRVRMPMTREMGKPASPPWVAISWLQQYTSCACVHSRMTDHISCSQAAASAYSIPWYAAPSTKQDERFTERSRRGHRAKGDIAPFSVRSGKIIMVAMKLPGHIPAEIIHVGKYQAHKVQRRRVLRRSEAEPRGGLET